MAEVAQGAAGAGSVAAGGRPQAGIGVHMLEIARMERALSRHPGLVRVFSEGEQAWCARTARPVAHYAELFAARGAVVKALGVGSVPGEGAAKAGSAALQRKRTAGQAAAETDAGKPRHALDVLYLREVSVVRDESGRPHAELAGHLAELAQAQGVSEVVLSLSTTHEVAVANAVAVTEELRPPVDDTPDPAEELRATFRAARSVLDELEQFQAGAE